MEKHLKRLIGVSTFACPPVSEVHPATISQGEEYIEILSGGRLRFEVNGAEKIFTRGAVFWHRAGEQTICRTFPDDPYRCYVLRFEVNDGQRPGPRVSIWNRPEEAVLFARECHSAFHSGKANPDALAQYAYSTLRWKALANSENNLTDCPPMLLEIKNFIRKNLAKDLTPEKIAASGGLSKPYLFALFKKYFQQTPGHYLQEQRIAQAKILLTASDSQTIKEIADSCGFNALEVFYRQFKKQTGLTPAEYRRKYQVPVILEGRS